MARLILEGESLGEKRHHYNKLLKNAILADKQINDIDYDDPDVDNLFKIDIAGSNRNVEYMLKVLKCEDMLYVSRALKVSVWLITDNEYEHIINPEFIHSQLLPEMTSKAGNKFLLSIRLNLKDEIRVDKFCNFYKQRNINTALKWLPKCSLPFIEQFVQEYGTQMSDNLIARLCEKSFTILEIYLRGNRKMIRDLLPRIAFLLNIDAERYLRIIDSYIFDFASFSSKWTQVIMMKSPDTVLNNFEKYAQAIDIPTFVKHLKKENVKDILIYHAKNKNLKHVFTYRNLSYFIYRVPHEDRFNFVKNVFIDKLDPECTEQSTDKTCRNKTMLHCVPKKRRIPMNSSAEIYRWYKFAPFDTAYTDLIKMIKAESNPSERIEMFAVIINSAGRNLQNVKRVLQYYRVQHINEPFKFKRHFVNTVLSYTYTHRFDIDTWNILNDIFNSMQVYSESDVDVEKCVHHIILYNAVHDIQLPDIIKKKFQFNTLKSFRNKLNSEEKNKVFDFLYKFSMSQLKEINVTNRSAFSLSIINIENVMKLLIDWKKDILEYKSVIDKVYELIEIKKRNSWNENLSAIYNINKSWRKHMFDKSLLLYPSQEVCIDALKYRPQMLVTSENIDIIYVDNSISLTRCLNKMRIYYSADLAPYFEKYFLDNMAQNQSHNKYKLWVSGLCALLPQKKLKNLLVKYAPSQSKIDWSDTDLHLLTIQQMFAKYMILIRPQLPLDVVLMYAQGDFLQYAIRTINSVLYNISWAQSQNYIEVLLNTPLSMQKHGLRFAFTRLKSEQIMKICLNTWKSTKNLSIRSVIFKITFQLLLKEQNELVVKEIWLLMASMIDSLTSEENKTIYHTLGKVNEVPVTIRPLFCVKSYTFLKSLPTKTNCDNYINSVIKSTLPIMEFLNEEFVANIIFGSFDEEFTRQHYNYIPHISACLLSARCEISQTRKYDRIFTELFKRYLNLLNKEKEQYYLKQNFVSVLHYVISDIKNIVFKKHMIMPTKLCRDILCDLIRSIPEEDNYVLLTTWKLASRYINIIHKYRTSICQDEREDSSTSSPTDGRPDKTSPSSSLSSNEKAVITCDWDFFNLKIAPEFGNSCVQLLNELTKTYFSSFYTLFYKALEALFEHLDLSNTVQLSILKSIQEHTSLIESQLLVLKALTVLLWNSDSNEDKEKILKIFEALRSHSSAEVRVHCKNALLRFDLS